MLDPNANSSKTFELFLLRPEEAGLEIQFANTDETENEMVVHVAERIIIPRDRMISFLLETFNALEEYEKIYKNGFGIRPNDDEDRNDMSNTCRQTAHHEAVNDRINE